MTTKFTSLSLSLIMLSVTCYSSYASDATLSPEITQKAQIALKAQITHLKSITHILSKVTNKVSAQAAIIPVSREIAAYKMAELQWDHIEDSITDAQEDILEAPYERELDRAEDRVEDLAERLYKVNRCYGSDALMVAIHSIAD